MNSRIEQNDTEVKLSLTYDELIQIFEDMGVVVENPKQKFQLEFSSPNGGLVLSEFFGDTDSLGIAYRTSTITVVDLGEDPESPPDTPPPSEPIHSCENCLPNTLHFSIVTSGCGNYTNKVLTKFSSNTPEGTYNKTWRSSVASTGGTGCPSSWYLELVCVSYNEDTLQTVLEIRSMDSSYQAVKQFTTRTITLPCNATGSITFTFSGVLYPGYISSLTITNP